MLISPLFILAAIFSETVGTFAGFGATTILLPLTTFLMPVREAIVLVGVFHFFGTTFRTILFARKVNVRIALLFGIPSLVFSFLGASLLTRIDTNLLTRMVGVILVIYAFYSLFKNRVKLPRSALLLVGGGGIVGFLAGLIGTAGAIRGAFLTSWGLTPEVYLGTGALMGLGADTIRVIAYWRDGLLNSFGIATFLILVIVAFVGSLMGRILVLKTKEKVFAKIIFVALILAGARLLFI